MRLRLTNLLVLLILLVSSPSWATVVHVQDSTPTLGSGTTCVPPAITVTAGNALVVVDSFSSVTNSTIASVPANTWVKGISNYQSNSVEIWYALNAAAGSTTVTLTNTSVPPRCNVLEFSGVATAGALDQTASATGTGTTTSTGTTPTVAQADEVGVAIIRSTSTGTLGAIAGTIGTWTSTNIGSQQNYGYNIGGSVGTYGATSTIASGNWTGAVLTLKGAAPPSTSDETINEIIMSNP